MSYLEVFIGLVCLLWGAEVMLRGTVAVASRMGISPLVIGMTVIAFGTSAPELVVGVTSALSGFGAIALGNIVGSNIANIFLILGATGIVAPILVHPRALRADATVMLLSTLFFAGLSWRATIGRGAGGILVAVLIGSLWNAYQREKKGRSAAAHLHVREAEEYRDVDVNIWAAWGFMVVGLSGVVFGSKLLVDGGVDIARTWGVSEAVIGLTLVALGTSLPELATALVAARRGHGDVALGTVIGSNIFNVLGVGGISALTHPLGVPEQMRHFDLWVMLAATFAIYYMLMLGRPIGRKISLLFLLAYGLYIFAQGIGADKIAGWFAGS
ncbi:calcium/sodium antiporter [Varunaivibrio sulfuroxidans]|uniref:Cation:H+ antiporter n=1 Tax=Varunaivibrio sulfuroxidans TaxID=1773489 RepID=A0A4R3J4Z1_9PROT|nr:calcium/sodium antiporter [Varunaivibrio sulfuroxidans]TCS60878.1 cation:H+ antiporter [Varunaivibrio sulfuroxidans]WES31712.1 calcium/sodium antiporter [Varunaivibrio sulfuroxidans]